MSLRLFVAAPVALVQGYWSALVAGEAGLTHGKTVEFAKGKDSAQLRGSLSGG